MHCLAMCVCFELEPLPSGTCRPERYPHVKISDHYLACMLMRCFRTCPPPLTFSCMLLSGNSERHLKSQDAHMPIHALLLNTKKVKNLI